VPELAELGLWEGSGMTIDKEAATLIGLGEMIRERNEALQTLRAVNALAQQSFGLQRGRMLSALIRIEEMTSSATKEAA
jgi:hypothetical protein